MPEDRKKDEEEEPSGDPISRADWEAAIEFLGVSEGAWEATPSEIRRAKCLQAERERGVRRIDENLSIVPGSLVEELKKRLSAGENVLIVCGRVVTMDELFQQKGGVTITITEDSEGKKNVVVSDEG